MLSVRNNSFLIERGFGRSGRLVVKVNNLPRLWRFSFAQGQKFRVLAVGGVELGLDPIAQPVPPTEGGHFLLRCSSGGFEPAKGACIVVLGNGSTRVFDIRLDRSQKFWSEAAGIEVIPGFVVFGICLGDGVRNDTGTSGVVRETEASDLLQKERKNLFKMSDVVVMMNELNL